MRILTVIDYLGPGGRQRAASTLARGYARRDVPSAVLAVTEGGPREAEIRSAGLPLFIGDGTSEAPALDAALDWAPDVLHVHVPGPLSHQTGLILDAFLDRFERRPTVLETSSFGKIRYHGPAFGRGALADVVLLKGAWALWRWQKWTQPFQDRPPAAVVPNPVDVDTFYPLSESERLRARASFGIPPEAFVFGRVGQPAPAKWSPVLFDAFERVARDESRAHLLLVGLPETLAPRVRALPEAVRARIHEVPFLHGDAALREGYAAMDVFAHASTIGESFGQVLAESLLCERPVITLSRPSRDNSQLEVVGHERGGLVVNDASGMADAMRRLLRDPALVRRLAMDGAAHVTAHYATDVIVGTLLQIADAARAAPSRDALADALDAIPGLRTYVSDAETRDLLSRSIGRPSITQLALRYLIHVPAIARAYFAWKDI